tara:strand:+ start:5436 stop:6128 length:693 start_codon:yes stop_codon:yes gene_type:complete
MKTLGLFGGSFKPFTTGHFAKLALALQENDEVILFYTISKRDKEGAVITKEMSREIYEIVSPALKEEYGDKLKIKISNPTPIINIFEEIGSLKDNTSEYDKITIYGGEDIIPTFITSVIGKKTKAGEDKEEKYYGDLYRSGKIVFKCMGESNEDLEVLKNALSSSGHAGNLEEKALIRGTQIRKFVQNKDINGIINYLPNVLTSENKNNIVDILFSNQHTNQGVLLPYVG